MYRYIYSDPNDSVFLEDTIELEIDLSEIISAASYSYRFNKFTTVDNFRKEVAEMLIKKYKFDVLTETIDGKQQKGWCTNSGDSISVYMNTFYNLVNAKKIAKEYSVNFSKLSKRTQVKCFIHLSVSDHTHANYGDVGHLNFVNKNLADHTAGVEDIEQIHKDERIEIPKSIRINYTQGLKDLEYEIERRIVDWVIQYNKENT